MPKLKQILIMLMLVCPFASSLTSNIPPPSTPLQAPNFHVQAEVYILDIYNIDFTKHTYDTIFWLFLTNLDPHSTYNPIPFTELTNAIKQKMTFSGETAHPNGTHTYSAKVFATIHQPLHIENYPFDKQTLSMHFENTDLEYNQFQFTTNPHLGRLNQYLDHGAHLHGWIINDFSAHISQNTYHTDFATNKLGSMSKYGCSFLYRLAVNPQQYQTPNLYVLIIIFSPIPQCNRTMHS